ncbi:trace amine-associated receptor 1-like [Oculina patagonica]
MASNSSVDDNSISGDMIAVQFTLFIILLQAAVVGNGLLFFLFIRNRTLRTVHHALIANLSMVDLLNSVINIPLSICYVVLDTGSFRGKKIAWTVSFLHSCFALLSLSAIALQMIDRYLAICWPVFYKAKKSLTKVIAAIFVKWLVVFAIVLAAYIPLYGLDIGHVSVLEYRELYARESGQKIPKYIVPIFVFMILLFGGLSLKKLKNRAVLAEDAVGQNRQNSPNTRARKKAVYTILILLSISMAAYLPAVINGRVRLGLRNQAKRWLVFVIIFMLSVSSTVNPYIALIRVKCFADKLKVLINSVKVFCCNMDPELRAENITETAPTQTVVEIEGRSYRENVCELIQIRCNEAAVISHSLSRSVISTTN